MIKIKNTHYNFWHIDTPISEGEGVIVEDHGYQICTTLKETRALRRKEGGTSNVVEPSHLCTSSDSVTWIYSTL